MTLEKYNNQCIPDGGHNDNPCGRHWGNPVTTGTSRNWKKFDWDDH